MFCRIYLWNHLLLSFYLLEVLITDSFSLLVISVFSFSISSWLILFREEEIYWFLLGCSDNWHINVYSSLLYFCGIVVTSPHFIILFIWAFSLLFLMDVAKCLSVLFIFSKNQLFISLIFCIGFCSLFHFFILFFIIFFLLLTLSFVLPYLIPLGVKSNCLLEVFLVFPVNIHLRTAFAASHTFWKLHFHFHLSQDIFSFPLWFLHWPICLGYSPCVYIFSNFLLVIDL